MRTQTYAQKGGRRAVRGFTMLELMIVVAIIGLLAAMAGPRVAAYLRKADATAAQAQISLLAKSLEAYRAIVGRYPTTEQGLRALTERPGDEPRWNGPYLDRAVPPDPWGRTYIYRAPGASGRDFDLISYGRDGVPGGSGDDADIVN
ncbi:MAG: type II secretion system major pseudopilin GspG [Burkholderiales bacterium]